MAREAIVERVPERDVPDAHERTSHVVARTRVRAEAIGARSWVSAALIFRRPVIRFNVVKPARQTVICGGEAVIDEEPDAGGGEDRDIGPAESEPVVEASLPARVVVTPGDDHAIVRGDLPVAVHVLDTDAAGGAGAHRAGEGRIGRLP